MCMDAAFLYNYGNAMFPVCVYCTSAFCVEDMRFEIWMDPAILTTFIIVHN
jgi:hypothetical protein